MKQEPVPQASANCYIWLAIVSLAVAVASHVCYWLAMAAVQHGWLERPRGLGDINVAESKGKGKVFPILVTERWARS